MSEAKQIQFTRTEQRMLNLLIAFGKKPEAIYFLIAENRDKEGFFYSFEDDRIKIGRFSKRSDELADAIEIKTPTETDLRKLRAISWCPKEKEARDIIHKEGCKGYYYQYLQKTLSTMSFCAIGFVSKKNGTLFLKKNELVIAIKPCKN